jgi:anti-sigma regulatory factor (Ser/Thr protein kinase)
MANTQATYRFEAGFGEAEILGMRESVARQMHEAGVSGNSSYALINVLDEFCCNLMEYAQASWVEIKVDPGASSISASLSDDGTPFDPTEAIKRQDPGQPSTVTDRRLGLFMIGQIAKDLKYRREGSVNHLEFSLKR